MFYKVFLCCFCCSSFVFSSEKQPVLKFRAQDPLEAFSYIEHVATKLPWFKENGYDVVLPNHPKLQLLYEKAQNLSEKEKEDIKQLFVTQIYDKTSFDLSLSKLHDSEQLINHGLQQLSILAKNWAFDLKEEYTIVVTMYGPGGSYYPSSGKILLLATERGEFLKKRVDENILHEMVHIGIENSIVKKYKLQHREKERLVDLICLHYLKEILPSYEPQQNGDKRIDPFVTDYAIVHDLPSAIQSYVQKFPR